MEDKTRDTEAYYTDEDVIGSVYKYHRPTCPVVGNIDRKNRKRLQNWQVAVALGLKPCGLCRPLYLDPPPAKRKIGF